MAGRGRGFTNERHAPLKAGVAAAAVAGFALAWAGFASSHEDVPGGTGDATAVATRSTKPAGATPATTETPRTGGPLPTLIPGGGVGAGGGGQPAVATATATRARRSRGS